MSMITLGLIALFVLALLDSVFAGKWDWRWNERRSVSAMAPVSPLGILLLTTLVGSTYVAAFAIGRLSIELRPMKPVTVHFTPPPMPDFSFVVHRTETEYNYVFGGTKVQGTMHIDTHGAPLKLSGSVVVAPENGPGINIESGPCGQEIIGAGKQ